jgi:hypothetical protein
MEKEKFMFRRITSGGDVNALNIMAIPASSM